MREVARQRGVHKEQVEQEHGRGRDAMVTSLPFQHALNGIEGIMAAVSTGERAMATVTGRRPWITRQRTKGGPLGCILDAVRIEIYNVRKHPRTKEDMVCAAACNRFVPKKGNSLFPWRGIHMVGLLMDLSALSLIKCSLEPQDEKLVRGVLHCLLPPQIFGTAACR